MSRPTNPATKRVFHADALVAIKSAIRITKEIRNYTHSGFFLFDWDDKNNKLIFEFIQDPEPDEWKALLYWLRIGGYSTDTYTQEFGGKIHKYLDVIFK